jgi:hypothetical protein
MVEGLRAAVGRALPVSALQKEQVNSYTPKICGELVHTKNLRMRKTLAQSAMGGWGAIL